MNSNDSKPWLALLVLGMALLAGTVIYHVRTPLPEPKMTLQEEQRRRDKAVRDLADAEKARDKAEQQVSNMMWMGTPEQIGIQALAEATQAALTAKVQLVAFRPQRTQIENGFMKIPFAISLEGEYPQIVKFVETLESTKQKFVLNVVQITGGDRDAKLSRATVNIWVLKEAPKAVSAKDQKS